jgi:putative inorganic carbon (hco3(-)) transporter
MGATYRRMSAAWGSKQMIIEWAVATLLVLPAIAFAAKGSSLLVDYSILLYVFNREIRRVVEWYEGSFNPFSPISLTPLIVLCLLMMPFFSRYRHLHPLPKQMFALFFFAIAYATLVGFVRTGLAAVYGAAEYLAAMALMGYTATASIDDRTTDRWLKTAGRAAIAACAYGWFQYLTVPPWDAFWVEHVGLVGYLGKMVPTEIVVFSTFPERGPCAAFLAFVLIPMLVSRRWRLFLGWPEALLILSVILLTMVRTGIILIGLGLILYPVLNRGKGSATVVVVAALVAMAAMVGLNRLPNCDRITSRVSTLSHMQDDGSYQGRIGIAQGGIAMVLSNPAGFGMGSTGIASRVNTGSQFESRSVVGDGGYLELLASMGLPGAVCFAAATFALWRHLSICSRFGLRDDYLGLARVFLILLVIGMLAGNFLTSFGVMWIAFGRTLSPMMLEKLGNLFVEPDQPATSLNPRYLG